jgi:hypothetical protein
VDFLKCNCNYRERKILLSPDIGSSVEEERVTTWNR